MARIQVYGVNGKSEQLWNALPKRSRSKAIEQAIILLAQHEVMAPIFFDDMEKIEAILKGTVQTSVAEEASLESKKATKQESNNKTEAIW